MTKKSEKVMGYSVKEGKMVEIINPTPSIMRNGMKMLKGKSAKGDVICKIVGKASPEELKAAGIKVKKPLTSEEKKARRKQRRIARHKEKEQLKRRK